MEIPGQLELAAALVESLVGQAPRRISPLAGGQVGRVFRADTAASSYLVKLVDWRVEPDFEDEAADDRVYGNRFSNLRPAHDLLRQRGLPTPRLHGSGVDAEQGVCYSVFDYLEGDPDDFTPTWFSAVGASLRDLHAVTRPYQGWVGMRTPLPQAWSAVFQEALEINLAKCEPFIARSLARTVARRVREAPPVDDPHEFVLSHTDGFQALLRRQGDAWRVLGHIDVEDFQFTDRRFVLTGFELSQRLYDRVVPDAFWRAYGRRPAERHLSFELLYLLVWTRVVRDHPESFATCIAELERIAR